MIYIFDEFLAERNYNKMMIFVAFVKDNAPMSSIRYF